MMEKCIMYKKLWHTFEVVSKFSIYSPNRKQYFNIQTNWAVTINCVCCNSKDLLEILEKWIESKKKEVLIIQK